MNYNNMKNEQQITDIPSGFTSLDEITGGWQPATLNIIAARPAMGKTAFILSMMKYLAEQYSISSLLFSLEMSKENFLNRETWNKLLSQSHCPVFIDDRHDLTLSELRLMATKMVQENDVKVIFIDYIQLLGDTASGPIDLGMMLKSLNNLAVELNIPIIANYSLKMDDTKGKDSKPTLGSIGDVEIIRQYVNTVCFLHRPEYYFNDGMNTERKNIHNLVEVDVVSPKINAIRTVTLKYENQSRLFTEWQ